jgi:hypothetical protein
MIFEQQQIEKLLEIIDLHSSLFITSQMGEDVLSSFDKYILNKFGFDVKNIVQKYPPYFQNFIFGRLTSWLSDNQASRIVYSDFKKHLETGQYFPLTNQEQNLYSIAKKRSYSHIKNLGSKMKETLTTNISEEDVRRELSESISKRKSIQSIISEWGNKTGNWQRDYGRIAETEMNSIFNLGRATQFKERHGEDVLVFKETFSGACRHCIRLHLTGGIGSKPIVKPVDEIIANGTNIGRKVADWKFTIDSEHPFCRCILKYVLPGMEWNEEKKMFLYPEKYERKIPRRSKVIITVGDKKFEA